METLVNLLHYFINNRFLFLVVALLFVFFLQVVVSIRVKSKTKKIPFIVASAVFVWGILFVFFFGSNLINKQIFQYGEKGEGVVVGSEATGDLYNEEPIIKYEALIKTETGKTIETSFTSDSPNLYPMPDGVISYPADGIPFNIRYLKKNPSAFVIVTNDDSAYAKLGNCAERLKALNAAKNKLEFDTENALYKEKYQAAIDAYLESKCIDDPGIREFYVQERSRTR